jgi:hypothetical protein
MILAFQGTAFAFIPAKPIDMKKLMILLIAVTGFAVAANAQLNVSINIGTQPVWGPTGYDHVDYYYMPDIETYYSVPERVYIYREGSAWKRAKALPSRYSGYDVYKGHKVVINNIDRPYLNHDRYRKEYAGYKGKYDQTPIRDSKEEKYWANRKHPQHAQWKKSHNDNRSGNKYSNNKGGNKGNKGNDRGPDDRRARR